MATTRKYAVRFATQRLQVLSGYTILPKNQIPPEEFPQ